MLNYKIFFLQNAQYVMHLEALKKSYRADTILQNDDTYYPARKMIDVEIQEIKVTKE